MSSAFSTPPPARRQMSLSTPPDLPFVPDGLDKSDGLTGDQRRDIQQHVSRARHHTGEVKAAETAIHDYQTNLAMQSVWLVGGSYLIHRGFSYADPMLSFATKFTKNQLICRLMNPVSIVGLVVAGVTAWQLPGDVSAIQKAYEWRAKANINREIEVQMFESKMESAAKLRTQISGFDEEAKK